MRFRKSTHAVYNLQYHIVWTPRYRRKILVKGVKEYLEKTLRHLDGLEEDIEVEKVFIGALNSGDLVTGPKKPIIPPKPNKVSFQDGWEVMGIGTIFANKSMPQIHIHSSMGKKLKTLTGCVRGKSKVFLVIEAVVFELKGVHATKSIDPRTGINLLRIGL
jgi:predicted DNA-binding protein with PD1-like motif